MRTLPPSGPSRPRHLLLLAFGVAIGGLAACSNQGGGGIDLDPTTHRQVEKAPATLTNPPAELKDGTAQ